MSFRRRLLVHLRRPLGVNGDRRSLEKGMTLIEIILVIALIGTLMTYVISKLTGTQEEAMRDASRLAMQNLYQSLELYKVHNFRYPTTDQGLDALLNDPGSKRWRGPYTEKKKLNDPWDKKFEYESDGRNVKISSAGPDGEFGNEDDVVYPDDEADEGGGEEE